MIRFAGVPRIVSTTKTASVPRGPAVECLGRSLSGVGRRISAALIDAAAASPSAGSLVRLSFIDGAL